MRNRMKKYIVWVAMACLFLTLGLQDVYAAAGTGTIKGNNVNVRNAAQATGTWLCTVNNGDTVTVKGSKKDTTGRLWYQVTLTQNGKEYKGYVVSDYVSYKKPDTQADAGTAQADGEAVIDVSSMVEQPSDSAGAAATETPKPTEEAAATTTGKQTASKKKGVITGTNVNVRKKMVSGTVITTLAKNSAVTVIRSKKASDGKKWHYISFKLNGKTKRGWICSDYVKLNKTATQTAVQQTTQTPETPDAAASADVDFETYMQAQGFPESYKASLRTLHTQYPNWTFKAVQTGLEWNNVIAAESKVGMNFVSKGAIVSWKSTETAAYNWKNNQWYTFDGGSWVAASTEIVQYYMDPRNFLDESSIFQFESLEYEAYQNAAGVSNLLASSFMNGNYTEVDGTQKSYADAFVEVGQTVGVSPYHLAARCYQEQGKGKSDSISGSVSGYENIFNYYNIGAYASGGNTPVKQGLIYASNSTTTAANYERPWNSRYKSILGGAQYVAQKYVKLGQNTLYFQKFNVVNTKNGIYKHQYMTNLQAAASEAAKMQKAYTDKNTALVFYIPVYQNMPETLCAKPTTNANPNAYLQTISVTGQELTPVFDPEVEFYDLTVKKKVKTAEISAAAIAGTSVVSGTGNFELQRGENVFNITCTSQAGTVKTYTIHITRK